jgi:hypothetical protein
MTRTSRGSFFTVSMALGLLCLGPARADDAATDPCKLLTDAEVTTTLGQAPTAKKERTGDLMGTVTPGPACSWRGKSAHVNVTVETRESLKAFNAANTKRGDRGLPESPPERFKLLRQQEGADAVDVAGVGEAAFWDKRHHILYLTAKGKNAYVNINRHDAWAPMADDLDGAQAVAAIVGKKL